MNNRSAARTSRGFSMVELMVAMVLGLVLTYAMISVFISSKTAFRRQEQLNSVQQSVRLAFEYLASDARMVGHLGCYTGRGMPTNNLAATALATNYAIGVEGYEYTNLVANTFTLSDNSPANITDATKWATNVAAAGINTIPVATIGGGAAGDGLTPGSDALVIRTVAGKPVRLTADTTSLGTTAAIENFGSGMCSDGTTNKVSGFCANSHVLLASCEAASVFSVTSLTSTTLTLSNAVGTVYPAASAEAFPLQTIVYYVKKSSSGTSTSLYRRIFDGDNAGLEQELIEGVENMQLRYGQDTTAIPDGVVDGYVAASMVSDWSKVVAIRMSLLLRASDPVDGVAVAASGVVNGVEVTYPTTGSKYDRRMFTTTIAVRNKISYF